MEISEVYGSVAQLVVRQIPALKVVGSIPAWVIFCKQNTHTQLLKAIFRDYIPIAWVVIFFAAGLGARVEPLGPSRAPLPANFFRIPIFRLVKEL